VTGWGTSALVFYAIHGGQHLIRGHPEDLLWACHLGAVLVGVGILIRSATLNAVGFLWLCLGTTLWAIDLAGGGELIPTSLLTHVGGLAVGGVGVFRLGMPRHAWWKAILAFLVLLQLSRWLTPAETNVNLAFSVASGWEEVFASHLAYLALLVGIGAVAFFAIERAARRLLEARHASPCS
jgi:hypothetical protein